ncbi:MAG: GLUG motif-containing protein, partial [Chloroflexota bacterium]
MIRRILLPSVPIALALSTGLALAVLPVGTAHAADTNCPSAEGSYAGGTGTIGDPFLVSTPGPLQRLRDQSADWSKAVRLTADIDMGSGGTDCIWRTTLGNPSIANWTGTFEGDGHVVSGLDIEVTGRFAGFFAYLGNNAVVRDFGFTGDVRATATGLSTVQVGAGALAGWTLSSQIERSFTTGDVTVNISAAAAVFTGSATANPIVGGLVGTSQGTVTNSYATGNVNVTASAAAMNPGTAVVNTAVGGLLGSAQASSSIVTYSYSTGSITTSPSAVGGTGQTITERIGGSIGEFSTQYASATGVVWDTTASG